jgi:hypothetical protein
MDRISDSGSEDMGSNPVGITNKTNKSLQINYLRGFLFDRVLISFSFSNLKQRFSNLKSPSPAGLKKTTA